MSSSYVTEPPTKGKVVLHTTVGPIDIELWSKETPLAARNFIQLCMEGYYDNTIFHRIVKDFIVQGGDPTGTGTGGESIYGHPFKDEFHSRLRFSHRGIVAMANMDKKDSNGSQFFITFGRCDHLDRKHTIFGKVTGESLYNVLAINDFEINGETPVYPPSIISTEILYNPYEDIVPRQIKKKEQPVEKPQKKKTVIKKDLSKLSFLEEDEMNVTPAPRKKMKSMFDFSDAPQSKRDAEQTIQEPRQDSIKKRKIEEKNEQSEVDSYAESPTPSDKTDISVEQEKRPVVPEPIKREDPKSKNDFTKPKPEPEDEEQLRKEKERKKKARSYLDEQKQKYLSAKQRLSKPEKEKKVLEKLSLFRQSIHQEVIKNATAPPQEKPASSDDNENEDESGWKGHRLEFEDKTREAKSAYDDNYVVIDKTGKKGGRLMTKSQMHQANLQSRSEFRS